MPLMQRLSGSFDVSWVDVCWAVVRLDKMQAAPVMRASRRASFMIQVSLIIEGKQLSEVTETLYNKQPPSPLSHLAYMIKLGPSSVV